MGVRSIDLLAGVSLYLPDQRGLAALWIFATKRGWDWWMLDLWMFLLGLCQEQTRMGQLAKHCSEQFCSNLQLHTLSMRDPFGSGAFNWRDTSASWGGEFSNYNIFLKFYHAPFRKHIRILGNKLTKYNLGNITYEMSLKHLARQPTLTLMTNKVLL